MAVAMVCALWAGVGAWLGLKPTSQSGGPVPTGAGPTSVTDAAGAPVPASVERVICSGAGCLRLLTYLQAHHRIVAVDSIEVRGSPLNARPYAIANPQFQTYPIFGEFRGWDNPELIANLDPAPQIILKTMAGRGQNPLTLQRKTGIPVVVLESGNLANDRRALNESLRRMGRVVGARRRAEEVIAYFNALESDLRKRASDLPAGGQAPCYVGGIGQSGPHGLRSTDPSFASLAFTHTENVAASLAGERGLTHAIAAREQLVLWDPAVIFLDVSTLRLDGAANAVEQLRGDPVYRRLGAVRADRVYGLFPHNSYHCNFETVFANAYFIGKTLYPERFLDIDPMRKAEEIAEFLNGGPAFEALNREFGGWAFRRIPMESSHNVAP
jgi:iron complex transport system substrate-binding protein